jgi:hypothetical protein
MGKLRLMKPGIDAPFAILDDIPEDEVDIYRDLFSQYEIHYEPEDET